MSTCSTSPSRVRFEIAALALVGTGIVLIASPADPALSWLPLHPMWAFAIVLAARYGARGLWVAPALAIGLVLVDLLVGGGGPAAIARLSRGGDLAALAAAGLCAAVGTAHERRKELLEERLAETESRARLAETSVDELTRISVALRDRCDRSACSLAFLVDVAVRMSGSDRVTTCDAALELAMARSGALGGFLQLRDDDGQLRTSSSRAPAIAGDLTAAAAVEHATVVSAHEILGVRPEDSDLAAPVLDEDGEVIGVLALHLVPYSALGPAVRADLAAIARWAAHSLALERAEEEPRTYDVREVVYAHA